MIGKFKRTLASVLAILLAVLILVPQVSVPASALTYSGSSSYMSGKYYTALTKVTLTGDQRTDIVNVAKSQIGYQESSSSSQLSGTVSGSGNYTEYGRWYGMHDMWCAIFVSWCAGVAGVSTSVVPKHAYTPTGLSWFENKGQAYSRATVAAGGYTPQPGDIIYFKSSRNSNRTNHIGIVTSYSGGTVYTIEGNTNSATVSTDGGAVASKSYSISNTYIVYICCPSYTEVELPLDQGITDTSTTLKKGSSGQSVMQLQTSLNTIMNAGLAVDGEFGSATETAVKNFQTAYGLDIDGIVGPLTIAKINELIASLSSSTSAIDTYEDLGDNFNARINYPAADSKNLSLLSTDVIILPCSSAAAQIWNFIRQSDGSYKIVNSKNSLCLNVEGTSDGANVNITDDDGSSAQRWYICAADDGYKFVPACATGFRLNVEDGGTAAYTNVEIWSDNDEDAQIFKINKIVDFEAADLGDDFNARINYPAADNMNLSLLSTDVIILPCSSAAAQIWNFVRQSDDSYKIINSKNDLYLNIEGTEDGSNVNITDDDGSSGQRWYIYASGDGYKFVPVRNTDFRLNVEDGGTTSYTNIQIWSDNDEDAQIFKINKLEEETDEQVDFEIADLGDDFNARISYLAADSKNLSLSNTNVVILPSSSAAAQIWNFIRQSDGSYKIVNSKNDLCLNVEGTADGSNVNITDDDGSDAQRWYIYAADSGYKLVPVCATGLRLDVEDGATTAYTNLQILSNNDEDAQIFEINKLVDFEVADLGNDFNARINYPAADSKNLSLLSTDVIILPCSSAAAQIWNFVRQYDGSYKIINSKNGLCLNVDGASDGANVNITDDDGSSAQRWYIYAADDGYKFVPVCATEYRLNVEDGGTAAYTSLQIWSDNDEAAQIFKINKIIDFELADLGDDFNARINYPAADSKNLSLSNTNVVILPSSSAAAQIWNFIRQSDGSYKIVNSKNDLCLNIEGAKDGSNVNIADDDGSSAQRWYIYASDDGYKFVPVRDTGFRLDVEDGATASYTNLQILSDSDGDAQIFKINKLEEETEAKTEIERADLGSSFYARIYNSEYDRYVGAREEYSDIVAAEKSEEYTQLWQFTQNDDLSYKITNVKTGKNIELVDSGTDIIIGEETETDAQKWYLVSKNDGYVLHCNAAADNALDISSSDCTDITNQAEVDAANQVFQINKYIICTVNHYVQNYETSTGEIEYTLSERTYADTPLGASVTPSLQEYSGFITPSAKTVVPADDGSTVVNYFYNFRFGDVNGDTSIDAYDLIGIRRRLVENTVGDELAERQADVNGDGRVSLADLLRLKLYFADSSTQLGNVVGAVNLGNNFDARISYLAADSKNLSLSNTNVVILPSSSAAAQVWSFIRQADGSYKIVNSKNSLCLNVEGTADGANVNIAEDDGSDAQRWYIYSADDGYKLVPVCAIDLRLDVEDGATASYTNLQILSADDGDAQVFEINKLIDLETVDLGERFYARINPTVNTGLNLSLMDTNVVTLVSSSAAAQIWHFIRQSDGSYRIINTKNNYTLTVADNSSTSGANVQIGISEGNSVECWNIRKADTGYVLQPRCASACVLNVEGGSTSAQTNIEITAYTGETSQIFNINEIEQVVTQDQMVVLRNIMYAVETGGQVYGQARYDDFTEAYANSSTEEAITIGAGQCYAAEAKKLLNLIRNVDNELFTSLDTADIAGDLDTADWSTYQISADSDKAICIQAIISTDVGKTCQDWLMDWCMNTYLQEAKDLGVTDVDAMMMCANIRHHGGYSALTRVLSKTETPYTLDNIYAALQTDTGNQVGTYTSRQKMVYNSLKTYL